MTAHPYSVNLRERQTAYFWLALIAWGVSLLMGRFFEIISWTPPVWLDVPGVLAIFGLLCSWFEKQLWRLAPIRALGISTPMIAGRWSGAARSSYDDYVEGHRITATIHQTWTTISICVESQHSRSRSSAAAISIGIENSIIYCFENQPKVGAPDTMHSHGGTTALRIGPDKLEGEYYSGRDRQNMGTMTLERVK